MSVRDSSAFYITIEHTYTQRCYLLDYLKWFLVGFSFLNFVACVALSYYILIKWKLTQNTIQYWLIVLTACKGIWQILYSVEFFTCPWDSENNLVLLGELAEQMIMNLIQICAATCITCLFYLLGQGW